MPGFCPVREHDQKEVGLFFYRWSLDNLPQLLPQPFCCLRCKIACVVVKDDVHLVGLSGEVVRAAYNIVQFGITIIVVKPLGDRFARQVRLWVSSVEP